ncbi:MAG: cell division protein ZapB [Thermodesulfobacteriota bacterium]|nr:cell division protein ZapB [Thermodesulfobacteriota bacterium]MEA3487215.1 cell division protein ZapB [Thermodesulfobacteriota bacterium]
MELERFSELEQKIKKILEEYSTLKDRNRELEKLLEGKSAELEEVKSRVKILNEEKDAVRTGVDMLLDMLHDIEVP